MKGLVETTANLNKAIAKIKNKSVGGFQKAAVFVKGESLEITPIDVGTLRNSTFTDVQIIGNTIHARIGYTAKYAPWVHEMPMKLKGKPRAHFGVTGNQSEFGPRQRVQFGGGSQKGVYWQSGENKFLEKAIKRNMQTIVKIIAEESKI